MASRQRPRCATLMPNATCSFASPRASASAGEADRSATAAQAAMRRAITELHSLYTSGLAGMQGNYVHSSHAREQAICHGRDEESRSFRTVSFLRPLRNAVDCALLRIM